MPAVPARAAAAPGLPQMRLLQRAGSRLQRRRRV